MGAPALLVRVSVLVSTMDLTANTLPSITVSVYVVSAFASVRVYTRQRMKQFSRELVTLHFAYPHELS